MSDPSSYQSTSRLPGWFRSVLLGVIALLAVQVATARAVKFHGPIIQWHDDPTTVASFSWIEELAPGAVPLPDWREGQAGFGYGDADDLTELGDMKGHYKRVYVAKEFHVRKVPKGADIRLGMRFDDAFIAYINGQELVRSGNITGAGMGAKVTRNHEAEGEEIFTIPNAARYLKGGRNVICIEGHNVRSSSSDFTLQPRLFVGDAELIHPGEAWHYLAGVDPTPDWFHKMPEASQTPELAMEKASEWELLIRRRGSGDRFNSIRPKDTAFGESDSFVFRAKVEGLRPDTAYDYLLYAGKIKMKAGWFRTAPASLRRPMRFIVGGDMGTTGAVPMNRAVGKEDPLFAVVGGDLAYANGRVFSLWYDWLDNWASQVVAPGGRSIPIVVAIGNHETKSFSGLKKREIWKGLATLSAKKAKAPLFYSLFDLPGGEPNFAVDFADYLSFIVLDSGHTKKVSSQTGWLERQLNKRVSVKNLYALYHDPAWGAGIKGNNHDVQEQWCPLFEKYQVDAVFENDHHVYKRSHPLTGGHRDEERGIFYLGDGAWGAELRPITDRMLSRSGARNYLVKWRSVHHVYRVTLGPDGSRKYEAIDTGRSVFDSLKDSKYRRAGMKPDTLILPFQKTR
ncbi:MAG: metallophosphoesterase [Luteolibacter sp.]